MAPMPLTREHTAALRAIVGDEAVRTHEDLRARDPGVDPRNFGAGFMVRPGTSAQVSRVLAYCNSRHIGVVPQGGRTGLAGGAASFDGEVIVALDRLNGIESLDPIGRAAVAGAGVTLADLAARAAEHGLSPGIDLGARASATLGGLVSTNAGGHAAFRHGTMRDRVLGLEIVLADGSIISELSRVRKRNEGPAVERLLIGAEGTLGIVTRVAVALVAAPGPAATALVAVPGLDAAVGLCALAQADPSLDLQAVELMSANHAEATCRAAGATDLATLVRAPYLVLVEVAAAEAGAADARLVALLESGSERGLVDDASLAGNELQRRTLWRIREDWAVDRERPGGLWYDVSVPIAALPRYLEECRARITAHDSSLDLYVIGHLADGNLHLTVNADRPIGARYEEIAPLVTDPLAALGGSFSAEHGIGLEKKKTLARLASRPRLSLMRALKRSFDPNGVMNPGKVLDG